MSQPLAPAQRRAWRASSGLRGRAGCLSHVAHARTHLKPLHRGCCGSTTHTSGRAERARLRPLYRPPPGLSRGARVHALRSPLHRGKLALRGHAATHTGHAAGGAAPHARSGRDPCKQRCNQSDELKIAEAQASPVGRARARCAPLKQPRGGWGGGASLKLLTTTIESNRARRALQAGVRLGILRRLSERRVCSHSARAASSAGRPPRDRHARGRRANRVARAPAGALVRLPAGHRAGGAALVRQHSTRNLCF